ncbi:TPA: IspD/TarI family cytidylyltransferase [Streptococcus pneumoniae]|uniref:Putative IspD-family transferase (Arabinitol) Abp1 n=5 Tax=Streptococcus pneumoniae TaxID=1313 RepID=Q4K0D7_STREE|nr:IspD/TarI family cytidylyltransferase [Streptococcus pneumoniae]MBW8120299.1 2-C-methyl-D-erythritol 4-phosphate cytidylyltransferase [Streptococcus pneumoniae]MCQ0042879.1 2-C-methyl-D-erythritol 4-phosphate cytidylyltransferase [Streptococcus pneumoniae]MDS3573469.1 IspD/TarI family cytidylyltransferase [Streptococcus pneumoniae]MDS5239151.1 IspD/TarI family cytidylyltransferase [Streptococcus pneumoniae]MDS5654198.1 IspD/TarI family cytidylyltransferase [Streptococcus pneumoniae]
MKVAILTASGIGSRIGQDIPKQFIHVENKPVIIYTLEKFQNHPEIDEICIVILKGWDQMVKAYAEQFGITKLKMITFGGKSGQESIYNGLREVKKAHPNDDVTVLIHDGNRPLVSNDIISNALATYQQFGNAVAAIPTTEVVFVLENPQSTSSTEALNRDLLRRTQTPHVYHLDNILSLHEKALENGITDVAASCQLMQLFGEKSYFSLGTEKNLKITTVEDLDIFKALLSSTRDKWIK